MNKKFCIKCGEKIPEGRLKALPDTKTCTDCSTTEKVGGFHVITGKTTYTELQILPQEKVKELNYLQNREGSIVGNGVRGRRKKIVKPKKDDT